ncbi:4-hydroxybenzoate polyprenyltransferase/phosphoserine phosphatase [Loktanella ponticola]|uniref:4-hydroxybenzoate polyprenyltransferase/phosphoserine phosphatase n=1 Tax=Yoonia ponticola TaxID=1524255 RepID=A0A7W9EX46_9RHOB|nr:UbiA family prenyltransferase [Yoonia ponticola]MBB5721254.1 4-hydroxybenzoate polyprenyltransferase/phosphoserine phosphatase [Yoonia ponticola]
MDDAQFFLGATNKSVLIVDLDGTLIHTDMLYETFWSAISARWLNIIPAMRASMNGKAALKRSLEEMGPIDIPHLPYNSDVLDYIADWRAKGGQVALVSASDQRLVQQVADHLGLFDAVCGSDGTRNLKGPEKAKYLQDTYGESNFAYMGDAIADLEVWKYTTKAITVGVSKPLAKRVEALGIPVERLSDRKRPVKPILKAMRPHQWLKNVLIFLPMMAAHQFSAITVAQSILAFVVFSLIASSVYLLNDLLDLDADRAHPRKRFRPFASGELPLVWGTLLTPLLLMTGFGLSLFMGWAFFGVMALYYAVTTAYSFLLKRELIVDICALAGLYTLRIIAGGVATGIPLSVWLLAFSMFFFFSLASMKRQAELKSGQNMGQEKAHGRSYKTSDLPLIANMAVSSGYVSVLVMALYLYSDTVRALYSFPAPLWGICLVLLFWISRMTMISHRGWMHDDPVVFAARDYISIVCAIIIFVCAIVGTMF